MLDVVAYVNEFVSSSRKVLILDSGRIRENWPAGILHNGFADALQVALQEKPIERLFVLNSTRLDQRSHAAPSWAGRCSPGFSLRDCACGGYRPGQAGEIAGAV